jgi:hypothetical protein
MSRPRPRCSGTSWTRNSLRTGRTPWTASLDEEARSHLKNALSECTFWLGQDGLPVAWSRKLDFRLRVALVFSMDMKLDLHRRFLKHRDRLVVVSETMALKGKAMGHVFAAESRAEGRVEP